MTKKKVKSPAQRKREKRDAKILKMHSSLKGNYERATDLYNYIADKVECGYGTVILVLQNNGVITPKKEQQ